MKITGGTIDWSATYSGSPRLLITVEGDPDAEGVRPFIYESRRVMCDSLSGEQIGAAGGSIETPNTLYYAERDGFVRYFVEVPDNQHGYGGSVFNVVMTDGTKRAIKGPWSGNPGSVRAAGFPDVIDVAVVMSKYSHLGRSVTVAALTPQLDKITIPAFDPTVGWGWAAGGPWYEVNGPRVDFPEGSMCCLVMNRHGFREPAVLLPNGKIWRKPTTDQRTPARLAELAILERAKQYVGAGAERIQRDQMCSVYDPDPDDEPDEDDDGPVRF